MKPGMVVLSLLSFFFLSNCRSLIMEMPSGFAKYQHTGTSFLATSPDGVSLRIRSVKNQPRGTLEVISATAELQFKSTGYTLLQTAPLQSSTGWKGRYYITSVQTMAGDYRYLVAFFLDGEEIHLIEAGGRKEEFMPYEKELVAKLSTVR